MTDQDLWTAVPVYSLQVGDVIRFQGGRTWWRVNGFREGVYGPEVEVLELVSMLSGNATEASKSPTDEVMLFHGPEDPFDGLTYEAIDPSLERAER